MRISALLTLGLSLLLVDSSNAGITGRISLSGEPLYPDAVVHGIGDKNCHQGEIKTEDWKISPDKGLGDVVVSIENPPANPAGVGVKKISITQQHCRYLPHVSAMQTGGVATIKNEDATLHNVRGMMYLGKGKPAKPLFNVGQPIKGMSMEQPFANPGIYRLNCDVHPWMESWILVFKHPFFAVTDETGKFLLPEGLPDGEYILNAWHSRFQKPLTQTVKVVSGNAELLLTFDAAQAL